MMKMTGVVAALTVAASPLRAQNPDFTGSWKLNTELSDPAPMPGGGGGNAGRGGMGPATELHITQMSSKIVIEAKGAETSRTTSYSLDGAESRNAGMRGAEMTTRSTWVNSTIVTEGENTMTTPMGEMKVKTKEVRSLSADGKQMTVVMTFTTPRGERTRKTVYDKV
jgi:hypothetical protein